MTASDVIWVLLGRGMTEEGIAKKVGCTRSTVTNWKNGRSAPVWDHAIELLKLYKWGTT